MRQPAIGITTNLGNHNQKIDQTMVWFSSLLWIFWSIGLNLQTLGQMVSDHIMPQPSKFAIGKLKSFNFVELWYFTDEGCTKAQDSSRAQSDDAYGLMRVDNLVALKLVASFKASQNVIQDADLTWRQMNVSKNTMLQYMDLCSWLQKHVQSFTHFYFNIELLIMYQAKVRRQWHNNLA